MATSRRIGMHMHTGRGLDRLVENAKALGIDTIQIFTTNPSAWRSPSIDPAATARFKREMQELGVRPMLAHAMYLINLAGPNPAFYSKSKEALKAELRRAESYGCQYVVTHVGSHMGEGHDAGIERVVAALDEVLSAVDNPVSCLLETSAGGGAYVGARFEELAQILDRLPQHRARLGVVFDTAHAFASGYDDSGADGMRATLDQLTSLIPAERIIACHCNDSDVPLGGKNDKHTGIGQGLLGPEAFHTLLTYPTLAHCAFILETPGDEMLEGLTNLTTLRALL